MLSARLKQYYGRLRRPPGTHPLPGLPVIGHAAPATPSAGHRAGEGLSSSRRHHRYVPRPIRRGVLGRLHFQVFRAFRGLRPDGGGSALPDPTQRRATLTTPQASLHATDRILAPPITGLSTLGFDPTRFQTEPPVCYRASWQLPGPDFHRQATTSFTDTKIDYPELIATPPALLDALQILYSCCPQIGLELLQRAPRPPRRHPCSPSPSPRRVAPPTSKSQTTCLTISARPSRLLPNRGSG